MFEFVFDGALFRFTDNAPAFAPLSQLPPRRTALKGSETVPTIISVFLTLNPTPKHLADLHKFFGDIFVLT